MEIGKVAERAFWKTFADWRFLGVLVTLLSLDRIAVSGSIPVAPSPPNLCLLPDPLSAKLRWFDSSRPYTSRFSSSYFRNHTFLPYMSTFSFVSPLFRPTFPSPH
jgi:hypothetical protein